MELHTSSVVVGTSSRTRWCPDHSYRHSRPLRMLMRNRPRHSLLRKLQTERHSTSRSISSDGNAASAGPVPVSAAVQPPARLYGERKAVVVGAGPAGSTTAMFLARQGFKVEVYERRPQPKDDNVDAGRSYIIILIPRGYKSLEELGVQLPQGPEYKTKGTVRHNNKGKISISREGENVAFSRAGLAQFLIDEARSRYPDSITFHFDAECERVDIEHQKATFAGHNQPVSYDLLVGADGINSQVRAAMQRHIPDFTVTIDDSGREYKTYQNLRADDLEPPEFKEGPGQTLHLWTSDDAWTTVTAHSNPDGSYTGTFSTRTGGFSSLTSRADYEQLLRSKFYGIPEHWIPDIAEQTFAATPGSAGKRIRCSQAHAPGVVLLGDALSAVTPVFGQGCNSALESCRILDAVLTSAHGSLGAVPTLFNELRLKDVHALYELDRKAYSFFRRKGIFDLDFLQLLSHVVLGTIASTLVPFLYGSKPALRKLGSTTPYSHILLCVQRDSLAALLGSVGFLLLGTALAVAKYTLHLF